MSQTPPTLLAHYRAPAWRVREVALRFELDFAETRVFATLQLERHPERGDGEALRLQGEDLGLLRLRVDGRELRPDEFRVDADALTIPDAPSPCVVETEVLIRPDRNTRLEGLYRSGSFLTTQCEAEGFRRITYQPVENPPRHASLSGTKLAIPARFSGTDGARCAEPM